MNFDELYDQIRSGKLSKAEARKKTSLAFIETANAYVLDTNRKMRNGIPEIIYGEYKTYEQVIELAENILQREAFAIISRFSDNQKIGTYFSNKQDVIIKEKIAVIGKLPVPNDAVLIISGGCADHPIATEVKIALRCFGIEPLLYEDRGIAHPTRVLEALQEGISKNAKAAVVIAGMEASLATFASSLLPLPVIGVPTSVGYGYKADETALISMLASCTPNLAVVNIDGGIRAAVIAALIAKTK